MILVAIADSHFVIREGLKFTLSKTSDLRVAGEAATRSETLKLILGHNCQVLVIDLDVAGSGSKFEFLKSIHRLRPKLPVLAFGQSPEKCYGIHAVRSGAAGYLRKDCTSEELVKAVRKVGTGGNYVSPALAEIMVRGLACSDFQPHERLSARELEVFLLLAVGMSSGQIARDMTLSIKTISTYRARILEKMNFRTNAELVQYAILNELITDSVFSRIRGASSIANRTGRAKTLSRERRSLERGKVKLIRAA